MTAQQVMDSLDDNALRRPLPSKLRAEALAKHGPNCQRCAADRGLDVHHVIPVIEGGKHELGNLSVLCARCHAEWHRSVEDTSDSHEARRSRFAEWGALPPVWFMTLFFAKHGASTSMRDAKTAFRTVKKLIEIERSGADLNEMRIYVDAFIRQTSAVNSTSELTKIGLKKARARGVRGGRPPSLDDYSRQQAKELLAAGDLTVAQIAAKLGVASSTLYRHLPTARKVVRADREFEGKLT
jgi:hypothetical protein